MFSGMKTFVLYFLCFFVALKFSVTNYAHLYQVYSKDITMFRKLAQFNPLNVICGIVYVL